jgi:hypothetical protein
MDKVTQHVIVHVAAAQVWQTVCDFGKIDQWLPGTLDCQVAGQGIGAVRTIIYNDGFQAEERLESLDHTQYSLCYRLLTMTAFADAHFTMTVLEQGSDWCQFVWSCHFTPQGLPVAEAEALMANALAQGCVGLQTMLEQSTRSQATLF